MSNYIQVTAPDKQKLAELLLISKGRSRTLEEYSYDTDIDEDTLTNIINTEIAEPLEVDMSNNLSTQNMTVSNY